MEKIKNIISPGKALDDETLYGQGQSQTTGAHTGHSGLTGEGSHLKKTLDTPGEEQTSHIPGSYPSDTTAENVQYSGLNSGNTTTGPHSSDLANRVDPRINSDSSKDAFGAGNTGPHSENTTTGSHSSNLANRADPTVDSDRSRDTGFGSTQYTGLSSGSTTTGPHRSDLLNRADPTVDSDRSKTTDLGNSQYTGLGSTNTTSGPRSSDLSNQADPTMDSDRSRAVGGFGNAQHSGLGAGTTAAAAAHDSNLANRIDPFVDPERSRGATEAGVGNKPSGLFSSNNPIIDDVPRGRGGGILNSQTSHTTSDDTTAPHSSGILNRADPRIDSGLNTTGNSGLDNTTSTKPESGHHYGRDAAALGAAGAVGEGIHHCENERNALSSHDTTTNIAGLGSHTGTSGPHSTETANRLDPRVNTGGSNTALEDAHHHSKKHGGGAEHADHHHSKDTEQSSRRHLGQDTALGAGTVGLAEHEHNKRQGATSKLDGPAQNTAGPHKQDWLNKLDPRVNANPETSTTGTTTQTTNPTHHVESRSDNHLGRDAAIAGGLGGAGYQTDKSLHRKQDSGIAGIAPTGKTTTSDLHSSNLANEVDHTVDSNNLKQHHYGRDAVFAGGVGAGYEAGKGHHETGTESGLTGNNTTSGPHSSNLANRADPTIDSDNSKKHHQGRDAALVGGASGVGYEAGRHRHQTGTEPGPTGSNATTGQQSNLPDRSVEGDRTKDHHYGKDAAVAGGLGGAVYEAEKHKHDRDTRTIEKEEKREHKREVKEEKKEHKGLLSFLHRDKNKHDTHDKHDKHENLGSESNETDVRAHEGRLAEGSAVGAGAYEAKKHHGHHTHDNEANKALPTGPGNHGIGTGTGTQNTLTGENTLSNHHHVGAGALNEHQSHQHAPSSLPLDETPLGKDLGDKLHGVDRNRGVAGPTGFPDQEGFGTGPSHSHTTTSQQHQLGHGAGVGDFEQRKHEGISGEQYGNATGLTDRDTSGLGAAEQAGERKYDSMTGTGQHTGSTGTGRHGVATAEYEGRTRLHKDPPANHPAAQFNTGNY